MNFLCVSVLCEFIEDLDCLDRILQNKMLGIRLFLYNVFLLGISFCRGFYFGSL